MHILKSTPMLITSTLCIVLCIGVLCSIQVLTNVENAYAITAAEKRAEADAVFDQVDSLQTKLNDVKREYDEATQAHDEAVEKRNQADQDIKTKSQEIDNLDDSMSAYLVGMYKMGGSQSLLDVLLQASSFVDFIKSWDICNSITSRGEDLFVEYKTIRDELERARHEYQDQSDRAEQEMKRAESLMDQMKATQESLRQTALRLSAEADELQMQEELAAEAARQAEEARKRQEEAIAQGLVGGGYSAGANVSMGNGFFVNPCPSATSSSGFGYRSFDNSFHKGIDMAAPEGTPYYAADSGTVLYATNGGGYNGGAGNWVVISHGRGIVTKYMHSQVTFVSPGQHVERGQNIGLVGNTGQSFGAHLHFQVEVNGVAVNPLNYI